MFVLTFLQRYIIYLSHYHNEPTTHPYLYLGHDEHLLGCRKWEWQEITLAHSFKASEQTPNNTMAQCDINEMEVHGLLNRNSEDFTTNYNMKHKFQQFSARPGKRLLFHLFKECGISHPPEDIRRSKEKSSSRAINGIYAIILSLNHFSPSTK